MRHKQQIFTIGLIMSTLATSGNVAAQANVDVVYRPLSINHQLLSHSIAGGGSYPFTSGRNFYSGAYDGRNSNGRISIRTHFRTGMFGSYSRLRLRNVRGSKIRLINLAGFGVQARGYELWAKYERLYDEDLRNSSNQNYINNSAISQQSLSESSQNSSVESYTVGASAYSMNNKLIVSVGVEFLSSRVIYLSSNWGTSTLLDIDGSRIIASVNLHQDSYSVLLFGASKAALARNPVFSTRTEQEIPEYFGIHADYSVSERMRVGSGVTYIGFESAGGQESKKFLPPIPQQTILLKNVVQINIFSSFEFIKQVSAFSIDAHYSPDISKAGSSAYYTYGDILSLSFGLNYRGDWLGMGLTYVNSSWLSEYDSLTDRLLLTLSTNAVF